jgi:flagellar hook-associated protein 3 FlgL
MAISRISTNQYFENSVGRMSSQQQDLVKIQGQLATAQRVLKPSDDPLAMATALGAKAAVKTLDSFQSNITYLNNQLGQMDVSLASASEIMAGIKESTIRAGNPILSKSDRETVAQDLEGRLQELMGLANSRDSNGNYLFAGTYSDSEPYQVPGGAVTGTFLETTTAAAANAITGRSIQVSGGRSIDLDITGYDAFTDPASNEDAFVVLRDAIALLRNPGYPGGQQGATPADTFKKAFDGRRAQLDNIFDQVQIARTKVGVRARELETVEQINTAASLEQERVAGDAIGLDYAKAISDLSQGQLRLQATQQAFAKVSGLTLFDFLR